ncbi:MAG: hypothetical protein FJZ08_03305 [Candidatus Omnitrophica bacterium]|nr:hypothetical protein [Candidatus Omnitrophota bacterium]
MHKKSAIFLLFLLLTCICGCKVLSAVHSGDVGMRDIPPMFNTDKKSSSIESKEPSVFSEKIDSLDSWIKRNLW